MKTVKRVTKTELLEIAKQRIVLIVIGSFWVNPREADQQWIDETLPDIGEYELIEEDGFLIARYIG